MRQLTPHDLFRCQAEKSNDVTFMTLGGRREMVRCAAKPTWVAIERIPGQDGQCGSMSLCDACKQAMLGRLGEHFALFAPLPEGSK